MAALFATPATAAPAPVAASRSAGSAWRKEHRILVAGTYKFTVGGVLCNACTRAIVEALGEVRGVESARFDFEEGLLWLSVEKGRRLRLSQVERALKRAQRAVAMDAQFELTSASRAEPPAKAQPR